jgi:hypothetical protein
VPVEQSPGLSAGATAGIAVSVVFVGLAIISLGIWAYIKRRREGRYQPAGVAQPDIGFSQAGEGYRDKVGEGEGRSGGSGDGSGETQVEPGKFADSGAYGPAGPMPDISELPGSGGFGPASSASGTAYPSPDPGHNNVRTSYFQMSPGGSTVAPSRTCYDETRAELESPPAAAVHEMPGPEQESSANRVEMPGPVVPGLSGGRAEMGA